MNETDYLMVMMAKLIDVLILKEEGLNDPAAGNRFTREELLEMRKSLEETDSLKNYPRSSRL